jgi:hypothetical protein
MKKLLLLGLVGLTLMSCKKEECKCGTVTNFELEEIYFVHTIKNQCTGKEEKIKTTMSKLDIGEIVCDY